MNRKVVFVFLMLVFVTTILATLTLLPDEPDALPQPTLTPEVWDYLEALDFARATCKGIVEPLEENIDTLNAQTDKLHTLSGTMELLAFRSYAWPLEGRESCWVLLVGGGGQVFNFPQEGDLLTPQVIPVGTATLVFEDESGNIVVLKVNDGPVAEPEPILGGVG